MTKTLCIAIHDVAPTTLAACEPLFSLLDALGAPPATLLVVPDYHRTGTIDGDADFVAAIDRRVRRGDEIALHGYFHLDDAPPPCSPRDWVRRRQLTAGEGEFAALDENAAASRIEAGQRLLERCGWHARGFVAPAWLLGDGARRALAASGFGYTSTHRHLHLVGPHRRIAAPAISASVRSAWRRAASRRFLAGAHALTRNAPVVRVALHPADSAHADILDAWRELLRRLMRDRAVLTKSAALGLA